MNKKWISKMILAEDVWQIDIHLMNHASENEAIQVAENDAGNARLTMIDEKPCIQVSIRNTDHFFFESDVVITEISQEKQAMMGRSLDMSNDGDKEIAINALKTSDSIYIIEDSDMVPSPLTLNDFIARYGTDYRLSQIGYDVIRIY